MVELLRGQISYASVLSSMLGSYLALALMRLGIGQDPDETDELPGFLEE